MKGRQRELGTLCIEGRFVFKNSDSENLSKLQSPRQNCEQRLPQRGSFFQVREDTRAFCFIFSSDSLLRAGGDFGQSRRPHPATPSIQASEYWQRGHELGASARYAPSCSPSPADRLQASEPLSFSMCFPLSSTPRTFNHAQKSRSRLSGVDVSMTNGEANSILKRAFFMREKTAKRQRRDHCDTYRTREQLSPKKNLNCEKPWMGSEGKGLRLADRLLATRNHTLSPRKRCERRLKKKAEPVAAP